MIPLLDGRYFYLPDCNRLISAGIRDRFVRSEMAAPARVRNRKVTVQDVERKTKTLRQIILETTQQCNLRCTYCYYGGTYAQNRTHQSIDLDFTIAEQALWYVRRTIDGSPGPRKFRIGFYGGEPTLNLDLIAKVVELAQGVFGGFKVAFGITTNATHLNRESIRLLIENQFDVCVSLDGPRNIHDRYRRYAGGQSCYDDVLEGIMAFRQLVSTVTIVDDHLIAAIDGSLRKSKSTRMLLPTVPLHT